MSDPQTQLLRRALVHLTDAVSAHLAALDQVMQEPSSAARTAELVHLATALDLANDIALRGGLGLSLDAIARRKETGHA